MTLIADSGALYALYDQDDAHHRAVLSAVEAETGTLVIPTVILAEIDYLLREFLGIPAELDFIDGIKSGFYTLEPFTIADLKRCRDLIAAYQGLDLGLADAAIIATAERLGIRRVLTVDERDFRAVRPVHGTLSLLPADL
jgi:uncharacterized protein